MYTVSPDIARKEIEGWLDYKKVRAKERETKEEMIDHLVDAVAEGIISVSPETKEIKHKLLFPLEGIDELTYSPRITGHALNQRLQGAKMDMTMFSAYGAAITNQNTGVINKLDTEDQKIMKAICSFFM